MSAAENVFAQASLGETRADIRPDGLLVVGHLSNFQAKNPLSWIYFTATLDAAIWGAELAMDEA